MEMKVYSASEQVDPAVDLGVAPPPFPRLQFLREFAGSVRPPPAQIVEGILHQGCKMTLGGTSKSNKSWCLLDLAVSVASGEKWWGRRTVRSRVAYLNFELQDWAIGGRIDAICAARPECKGLGDWLAVWNLRGVAADLSLLRPELEGELKRHQFGLVIVDPVYKLLGDRDENANGDVAGLMNELETLAQRSGAAVVIGHHFAKGDSTLKNAVDRMSGAGAWARDPDSIMTLTPHEEEGCFTVTSILRNLPPLAEFVVEWDFPLMRPAGDLDPHSLRRPQSKNKTCSDREFVEQVLAGKSMSFTSVVREAEAKMGLSRRSTARYLNRLTEAGVITQAGGFYWASATNN